MAGINVGNFWSRMPGMVNMLGQQYGGDLADSARASSSLLGAKKQPKTPKVTNGIPRGQMPGQQMPLPQVPNNPIQTGPSPMAMSSFAPSGNRGGFWNPSAKGPLQFEMNGVPMGTMGGNDEGGLFGKYNRLSMGQTPFGYRF